MKNKMIGEKFGGKMKREKVSPEHKVYYGVEDYSVKNSRLDDLSLSTSSLVVNTLIKVCSLRCESLDQIDIPSSSANAKKGTSVLCKINLSALDKNSFDSGSIFTIFNIDFLTSSNDSFGILPLEQIKSQYLSNSLINDCGLNNSILCSLSSFVVNESLLNKENIIFVSTTSFIYNLPSCFNLLDISFLSCRPNLMQSSSVSSLFLNNSSNLSNISSCFILLANASLAIEDQLSHSNLSIFCLNSFGIDSVNDTMLTSDTCYMFINVYDVFKLFGSKIKLNYYMIKEDDK